MVKYLFVIAILTSSLMSAPTKCGGGSYFGGEAPDILNPKLTPKTKELCYSSFAIMHSGMSRTPLWAGEHLTKAGLRSHSERTNDFHAEEKLASDERAELEDYARSGYDRGHMAPSADMPNEKAQRESFSLANMIPQNQENNRGIWAKIEGVTRNLAKDSGEIYIVSGPIFIGSNLQRIGGRVLVPTKIYKAIFDPSTGQGAAYLVDNSQGADYEVVSIAKIEEITGIRLFPKMSVTSKQTAMKLPATNGSNFGGRSDRNTLTTKSYKAPAASVTVSAQCGSKRICREMNSCEEAMFYLNTCGISSLDGNNDGIPCSKLCK